MAGSRPFEEWMTLVDFLMEKKYAGMNHLDIPDYGYWDEWNRGTSASSAADKAMRAAATF